VDESYRRLLEIKDLLVEKSFRGVHATSLADEFVLHQDDYRARLSYDKARELISAAPSETALWSALGEAGLLWPRPNDRLQRPE
jgi:hypothetical protein